MTRIVTTAEIFPQQSILKILKALNTCFCNQSPYVIYVGAVSVSSVAFVPMPTYVAFNPQHIASYACYRYNDGCERECIDDQARMNAKDMVFRKCEFDGDPEV